MHDQVKQCCRLLRPGYCTTGQRCSRGHKAQGLGQGQKKILGQGQGQPFQGQTLSRPNAEMLEPKAKDTGASVLKKKKKNVSKKNFRRSTKKRS